MIYQIRNMAPSLHPLNLHPQQHLCSCGHLPALPSKGPFVCRAPKPYKAQAQAPREPAAGPAGHVQPAAWQFTPAHFGPPRNSPQRPQGRAAEPMRRVPAQGQWVRLGGGHRHPLPFACPGRCLITLPASAAP